VTDSWIARQTEKRDMAEVRTLGTILTYPHLTDQTIAKVEPGLFRREAHRLIADAIWSLYHDGKRVDLETVQDRLIGKGQLDIVGGPLGMVDVRAAAQEPTLRYADELIGLERRRQVWQACNDGARAVANPDAEPDDIAADVAAALHRRETFDESGPMTTDELLNLEVPPWLVDGIFPSGLSLLFGAEKTAKSYVALQTAWSFATGGRWFRRNCRDTPGQVLYLAGEGVADLKLRVEALVAETDAHPGGLIRWWTEPLSLAKDRDAAKLRLAVKECGAELVVVDTWRRFSGLTDENDASQVSAALAPLEDIAAQGTSVLVVHHSNAEGGIRGSTALAGAVESAARCIIEPGDEFRPARVALTSFRSRRGVGFQDITLGFKQSGPDSVLQEVHL
jgi:hypothetical protein